MRTARGPPQRRCHAGAELGARIPSVTTATGVETAAVALRRAAPQPRGHRRILNPPRPPSLPGPHHSCEERSPLSRSSPLQIPHSAAPSRATFTPFIHFSNHSGFSRRPTDAFAAPRSPCPPSPPSPRPTRSLCPGLSSSSSQSSLQPNAAPGGGFPTTPHPPMHSLLSPVHYLQLHMPSAQPMDTQPLPAPLPPSSPPHLPPKQSSRGGCIPLPCGAEPHSSHTQPRAAIPQSPFNTDCSPAPHTYNAIIQIN